MSIEITRAQNHIGMMPVHTSVASLVEVLDTLRQARDRDDQLCHAVNRSNKLLDEHRNAIQKFRLCKQEHPQTCPCGADTILSLDPE